MAEQRRSRAVSQAFLTELLVGQLQHWMQSADRDHCEVVDLGGGTGGLAADLAKAGHHVTVIDPSPDALASLERRTAEQGLGDHLRGVQGDAGDVLGLVGVGGADVVVCHRVLEVVDSPANALSVMAQLIRPGGCLSLLVPQRNAVVLAQALIGHLATARQAFADPRRFDIDQVTGLVTGAGFTITGLHGIGAVADLVSESLLESSQGAAAELYALEAEISQDPAFRAIAPVLHVFATR